MNKQILSATASAMVADSKGLLAMDESNPTCNKRFAALGISQTEEMRRAYREMIVTTPDLEKYISGAILYDETIRQQLENGTPIIKALIRAGIIPGIKLDTGTTALPGYTEEKITNGLDGLHDRLVEYVMLGARFAKWRAVIKIGESIPSRSCIQANAQALAIYAALCQEAGIVPIVEPEVLMEGEHTLTTCLKVTDEVLQTVFHHLHIQGVLPEGMILKPNMILPGLNCKKQESDDEIAKVSVKCFLQNVPVAVPGIAFLSGGQSPEQATSRLNAMHIRYKTRLPWKLTFSFSRALQQPSMKIWQGHKENVKLAQQALLHRARCNSAANRGQYATAMETAAY